MACAKGGCPRTALVPLRHAEGRCSLCSLNQALASHFFSLAAIHHTPSSRKLHSLQGAPAMPVPTINPRKRERASARGPSDALIPIRLDLTFDNHRIQETLTWNLLESQITPLTFATILADDLNLPESARDAISEAIKEQIASYVPPKQPQDECRHVVRLDIRIGRIVIRDQFEWDLSAHQNSPEAFAEGLCADLGLNSEHVPPVAHAIREQLLELAEFQDKRQKCAVLREKDVVRSGGVERWEPEVECLSVEEQERLERKERREARLMRRNRGKAEVYSRPKSRRRSTSSRRR
ncbi:SNF5/SMARCB1/INI1 [Gracilaria domingensis]|nr:SNF5/SMARCB1/INI1 [Gracilaria domingensis]